MIHTEASSIHSVVLHAVGNKHNEEPLTLAHLPLSISESVNEMLRTYFFSSFKENETFHFYHEEEITQNKVYESASVIFDNPEALYHQSLVLAKHLYDQCKHPKIKAGELYTVFIKDCVWEGELVDAVGLFKAETKDAFLKVHQQGDNFVIESDKGININKLDKGCLIFNTERERGYVVAVVDNTNKGLEAQYWMDDFLGVQQRKDIFYDTQTALTLCKDFVKNKLPEQFEVNRAEQVEILNKSVRFFKENENFDIQEFAKEVMVQPEVIESFHSFKEEFETEEGIEVKDRFPISENAVKKQTKSFRSVIKLDKNFHIYVHGNPHLIKKGFDEESGMNFYQVFFKEEL
jgi:hypothetical protein